ncbi:cupin domain-containing protein [Allocoprobacillus halotolerans]|uniref:cupin domain-containing protein n=1 Tax=Allocoprobacillus halotolerans TaxID=2944914 RepID=UPI00338F10BC
MHWHEDIQITYVIHGTIQVQTLDHSLEVQVGQAIFINKKILHQITEIKDTHYRSFLFPICLCNSIKILPFFIKSAHF